MMLPDLLPMLAVPAAPFDSPDHIFEVKWDGVRTLAAVEVGGVRLWGRERSAYTSRYPELATLRWWSPGTLVDGELVATEGRPSVSPTPGDRADQRDSWKLLFYCLVEKWKSPGMIQENKDRNFFRPNLPFPLLLVAQHDPGEQGSKPRNLRPKSLCFFLTLPSRFG